MYNNSQIHIFILQNLFIQFYFIINAKCHYQQNKFHMKLIF